MPFPIPLAALAFAAVTATGAGAPWIEAEADTSHAADMVFNVISKAAPKKPQQPKIVLVWRKRPKYLDNLRQVLIQKKPPQYTVDDWGLPDSPPYEATLRSRWTADVVCVLALGLEPDALHVLSQFSRSHGALTIGTEDDVDPLDVGLRVKDTAIYCSIPALLQVKVIIADQKLCRELTKRRTAIAATDLRTKEGTQAYADYVDARTDIDKFWKRYATQPGLALPERQLIDKAARVIQRDVAIKPDEGTLSSAIGGRTPVPYLAHYELGRAFYMVGNCEAVRLELPKIDPTLYEEGSPQSNGLRKLQSDCGGQVTVVTGGQ